MQSKTQRRVAWLSIILSLGLVAAACGGDDDDDAGPDNGSSDSENVSGEINISGSSTVEPISSLAAEAFMTDNGDVTVAVDGPGTGDGFELFCQGETDISDASRAIADEEVAACEEAGIEYTELQVAYDGMTVMTSAGNDAIECLNFADLYALIGPESEGFSNWSDGQAIATELGSDTELPDAELACDVGGQRLDRRPLHAPRLPGPHPQDHRRGGGAGEHGRGGRAMTATRTSTTGVEALSSGSVPAVSSCSLVKPSPSRSTSGPLIAGSERSSAVKCSASHSS